MKPCTCPISEPYWQIAIDGTQQRITETIHRLGWELVEGEGK